MPRSLALPRSCWECSQGILPEREESYIEQLKVLLVVYREFGKDTQIQKSQGIGSHSLFTLESM